MANERNELYQTYRPTRLEDVVGQKEAIQVIKGFGTKVPNCIMFHGPSGTGKTTLARILAAQLGCPPSAKVDFMELNCASSKQPSDMMRDLQDQCSVRPLVHPVKVFILDEFQSLTRARFAQEAALKILEDSPSFAYFMLCTTDPKKILKAIRGRCTQIELKELSSSDLTTLVKRVAKAEGQPTVPDDALSSIIDASDGSGREALNHLQKTLGIENPEDKAAAVGKIGAATAAFELVKVLIPFKGKPSWSEVARVLEEIKEEDPESVRQLVLASARTRLLKSGDVLAYKAIICLNQPFYDRNSGRALMAAGCFEICTSK